MSDNVTSKVSLVITSSTNKKAKTHTSVPGIFASSEGADTILNSSQDNRYDYADLF